MWYNAFVCRLFRNQHQPVPVSSNPGISRLPHFIHSTSVALDIQIQYICQYYRFNYLGTLSPLFEQSWTSVEWISYRSLVCLYVTILFFIYLLQHHFSVVRKESRGRPLLNNGISLVPLWGRLHRRKKHVKKKPDTDYGDRDGRCLPWRVMHDKRKDNIVLKESRGGQLRPTALNNK